MKQSKVSVSIVPDQRRNKNNESFPLKLRLTYKGERKYYATGFDANLQEWDSINSAEVKGSLRKIKNSIAVIESNALKTINEVTPFTFKKFESQFFEQKIETESLKSVFERTMEDLLKNNRISTAINYRCSFRCLESFKSNLQFEDVTKDFLEQFERWFLAKGKSITTVGIYLRSLRVIMNIGKENGIITEQAYPFGKRKYAIPTGKNIKKALNIDQIRKIFDYPVQPGSSLERAKDFWILSYLCNGMNITDIAHLRWKNVDENIINFEREKTKHSRRSNPIKIIILRNEYTNMLLKKWATIKQSDSNNFLFKIIEEADSIIIRRKKIAQFLQTTNLWMKGMGKELNFDLDLTTYVARHSFATILIKSGAPIEFASQSLGHTTITTTQKYFAGFDVSAQAVYLKALMPY